MSKSLCLGNNQMLVAMDQFGQVYDFYYPHIGLENHTAGKYVHKIGVFLDGAFSWLDNGNWEISIDYAKNSMIGIVQATNHEFGIKLNFEDAVYNEKNILVRKVKVINLRNQKRQVGLFFNQQFEIYASFKGDTALYNHQEKVIIHYKGKRVFLVNAQAENGRCFDQYSIGLFNMEGKEGTYRDAEDGYLGGNNIEHGSVDSVIGFNLDLEPEAYKTINYWIVAAKSIPEAMELNKEVKTRGITSLIKSTTGYWRAWLEKECFEFFDLDIRYTELFKKSLFIIESHCDKNGAIIASGDSDLLKHGRDGYSYVWPRDAALIVEAMTKAGYYNVSKNFFQFANEAITGDGYMLHKYRSDETLGASWHPWIRDGKSELPIQEDETALVIWALWGYYQKTRDLEFIEDIYNSLIKKAAEFMVEHIDQSTGLPRPTYDLWEEKFGVSTFTCAAVYAGLKAAENFARILAKNESADRYHTTANRIKLAILEYLWDEEIDCFVKMVNFTKNHSSSYELEDAQIPESEQLNSHIQYVTSFEKEKGIVYDKTIDSSSVYAMHHFDILDVTDSRMQRSIQAVEKKLKIEGDVGGICRYENDYYFRVSQFTPGNPWIITTIWLAEYYLKLAKKPEDLDKVFEILEWVLDKSKFSGILPEQLHPFNKQNISATPLIWSHSEYVKLLLQLSDKISEFKFEKVAPKKSFREW